MADLTIGKLNGLRQIADYHGIFTIAALDHRLSLQALVNPSNPEAVGHQTIVEIKKELIGILGPLASAVLLDPIYGAAQTIAGAILPKQTGLLVCVEEAGYAGSKTMRLTRLIRGWGVAKVKRMGASAVKLLVYYRRRMQQAATQVSTVQRVVDQCTRHDIAVVVEALSYPLAGESPADFSEHKAQAVIESAMDLTPMPMDVFKAEFPADIRVERDDRLLLARCQQLDAASRVPWVLLSAGVQFDDFCREVELACRAGASGFLAGRALWQEGIALREESERVHFFETVVADRMKRLVDLACTYGRPWKAKLNLPRDMTVQISKDWYTSY